MRETEVKVKVPEGLEKKMERFKGVNWSKIAIHSFSKRVKYLEKRELERKTAEISEISPDDKREVREDVAREVVKSCEETSKALREGKIKPMTLKELDDLMGL